MVLSDRVCVMRDGRIVQQGTPRDLYERPGDAFVAEFIGQANVLPLMFADRASATVKLGDGVHVHVPSENWRGDAGAPSQLIVRYHQIRLLTASEQTGRANVFAGTVRDVVYLGDRLRYGVDIGSHRPLVGEVVAGEGLPRAGERIHVELPGSCCIVI
jgi:ABC-type Fe3+/spermidine/putrescine transport system ATPase subunit